MANKICSMQRSVLMATAATILTVGISPSAWAQENAPATAQEPASNNVGLEDIIVTATKREQKLSDVGVSVTSLGGEALERMGITETVGITATVPNLINASVFGPGANTNFSIRGVAQNDINDGTESPIATYVDDVYFVATGAGSFPLYDMQRVEVLRGPQGTLFGRNSTGGLIHFISAKPNDEFFASASGSYGSYNERIFTGILNMPLGEKAALRVAGRYQNSDGYLKHITGNRPDAGQIETHSIRTQLLLKPSSVLTSLFKFSYDKAAGFTTGIVHQPTGIDAVTGGQFALRPDQDFYGTGPGKTFLGFGVVGSRDTVDNGSDRRLKGATSLTAQNTTNWEINDQITLTSVTAYNRYKKNLLEDCDGTQQRICESHYQNSAKQFTQELRAFGDMGALRWTIGAYYLNQNSKQNLIVPLYADPTPVAPTLGLAVQTEVKAKGYAAFANIEYDVSPQLTVIVGVRGARDEKHIDQLNGLYLPNSSDPTIRGYEADVPVYSFVNRNAVIYENNYNDATSGGLNRFGRNGWSGKIEIDYKPWDDGLIYASVSRGLKSAGFNNGTLKAGLLATELQFKPETLLAYEVGFKSNFMDNKASVATSAFYYDYKNFHVLNFAGLGAFITNRPARIYGSEIELNFRPVPALTLQLTGGVVDTKLADTSNAGGVSAEREMALAPSWTLSAMARYEFTVAGSHTLGVQVDGNARDAFFNNPGNDPASVVPKFTNVNARIDFADVDDRYNLSVSVRNLLNKRYLTSRFLLQGLGGYNYDFYNPPRMIRAELTVKFR